MNVNNNDDTTMDDNKEADTTMNANDAADVSMTDINANGVSFDSTAAVNTTNPATTAPAIDPTDENAPIEIVVSDNNNSQMAFKIRKNAKMGKLMARYAEQQGRNRATIRFLFEGERVMDGVTPADVSTL